MYLYRDRTKHKEIFLQGKEGAFPGSYEEEEEKKKYAVAKTRQDSSRIRTKMQRQIEFLVVETEKNEWGVERERGIYI